VSPATGGEFAAIAASREAVLAALRRRELGAAATAVGQLAALHEASDGRGDAGAHAELGDLWSALAEYAAAEASYTQATSRQSWRLASSLVPLIR